MLKESTLAYGNFNDQVLQAAYSRGQNVVIWDFEYVDLKASNWHLLTFS